MPPRPPSVGRTAFDEVEGQRRRPAEAVGAESGAVERIEILAEPGAVDQAETASNTWLWLLDFVGLALFVLPD